MDMRDDIQTVLVTEEQLRAKVAELGARISRDYAGKDLLLVSILKGRRGLYGRPDAGGHHPLQHRLYGGVQLRRHQHPDHRPGQDRQGPGRRPERAGRS